MTFKEFGVIPLPCHLIAMCPWANDGNFSVEMNFSIEMHISPSIVAEAK